MSSLIKFLPERTSLLSSRKTTLPRFLNPTKHFPKYQTLEAPLFSKIWKPKKFLRFKMSSLQKVMMERTSFEQRRTDLPRFLNPTKHFPKYQTIEATSLLFILKTQKVSSFQNVITHKMPSGTHIVVYIEENTLAKIPKPNETLS